MKRRLLILLFGLLALGAPAQSRDSLLRRINAIKADTQTFLYEVCTVPQEPDSTVSIRAAQEAVMGQIRAFCASFDYPLTPETIPADSIQTLCLLYRKDCYRSLACIRKSVLLGMEEQLKQRALDQDLQEARERFLQELLQASTRKELLEVLERTQNTMVPFRYGEKFSQETQDIVNDSFLVFFHPKSDQIWEFMSPRDTSGVRHDTRTGLPVSPGRHTSTPVWIYIEGL